MPNAAVSDFVWQINLANACHKDIVYMGKLFYFIFLVFFFFLLFFLGGGGGVGVV